MSLINVHADISIGTRVLHFVLGHYLHPNLCMPAVTARVSLHICPGSTESVLLEKFMWQNLMCWPIYLSHLTLSFMNIHA